MLKLESTLADIIVDKKDEVERQGEQEVEIARIKRRDAAKAIKAEAKDKIADNRLSNEFIQNERISSFDNFKNDENNSYSTFFINFFFFFLINEIVALHLQTFKFLIIHRCFR